jgi:hypothetical protein
MWRSYNAASFCIPRNVDHNHCIEWYITANAYSNCNEISESHLSNSRAAYCSSSTSVIMRFPSGRRSTTLLVAPNNTKQDYNSGLMKLHTVKFLYSALFGDTFFQAFLHLILLISLRKKVMTYQFMEHLAIYSMLCTLVSVVFFFFKYTYILFLHQSLH